MDEIESLKTLEAMIIAGEIIPATQEFFVDVPKMAPLAGGKTARELFLEERNSNF
jgi:hypothetical protein